MATHDHRDCKELFEKMSEYLDGELDKKEAEIVARHLEECGCCKNCVETLKATRGLMGSLSGPYLPDDVKDRLKACMKKQG